LILIVLLTISLLSVDVRLTKDNQLVIHHDSNVDRTSNFKGEIAHFTYEELQLIDSAYQYTPKGPGKSPYLNSDFPFRGKGYRIPLFSTFMDAFEDNYKNIEIKDNVPLAAELVWKEVQRKHSNDLSKVIVASGHCDVLRHFRDISGGRVATSACEKEGLAFFVTHKIGIGNFWFWLFPPVAVAYQAPVVSSGVWLNFKYFIDAAHSLNQKFMYWVINDANLAHELLDLGADGIVSDRTDIIYNVLHQRKLVQQSLNERLTGVAINSSSAFYIPESNPRETHTCLSLGCKILPLFMNHFTELFAGIIVILVLLFIRTNSRRSNVVSQPSSSRSSKSPKPKKD
jgi:glycerophosphoryl diester phosphodiesterase